MAKDKSQEKQKDNSELEFPKPGFLRRVGAWLAGIVLGVLHDIPKAIFEYVGALMDSIGDIPSPDATGVLRMVVRTMWLAVSLPFTGVKYKNAKGQEEEIGGGNTSHRRHPSIIRRIFETVGLLGRAQTSWEWGYNKGKDAKTNAKDKEKEGEPKYWYGHRVTDAPLLPGIFKAGFRWKKMPKQVEEEEFLEPQRKIRELKKAEADAKEAKKAQKADKKAQKEAAHKEKAEKKDRQKQEHRHEEAWAPGVAGATAKPSAPPLEQQVEGAGEVVRRARAEGEPETTDREPSAPPLAGEGVSRIQASTAVTGAVKDAQQQEQYRLQQEGAKDIIAAPIWEERINAEKPRPMIGVGA